MESTASGQPGDRALPLDSIGAAVVEAFDHVPDLYIFVKDTERRFIACSEPFIGLMGLRSKAQLLGKRDEDFSPAHMVEHYRSHDEAVLERGDPLVDLVELVRNNEGSYDWFVSNKTPIRNAVGTITGVLGVTRSLVTRESAASTLHSLTPAIELITREYDRNLTVEELAASVLMSATSFNRLFKQHFGTTPHKYLVRVRVMAACDLLVTSDLSISEVSSRAGFYDAAHLSHELQRARSTTPTAFRNRFHNAQGFRHRHATSAPTGGTDVAARTSALTP